MAVPSGPVVRVKAPLSSLASFGAMLTMAPARPLPVALSVTLRVRPHGLVRVGDCQDLGLAGCDDDVLVGDGAQQRAAGGGLLEAYDARGEVGEGQGAVGAGLALGERLTRGVEQLEGGSRGGLAFGVRLDDAQPGLVRRRGCALILGGFGGRGGGCGGGGGRAGQGDGGGHGERGEEEGAVLHQGCSGRDRAVRDGVARAPKSGPGSAGGQLGASPVRRRRLIR